MIHPLLLLVQTWDPACNIADRHSTCRMSCDNHPAVYDICTFDRPRDRIACFRDDTYHRRQQLLLGDVDIAPYFFHLLLMEAVVLDGNFCYHPNFRRDGVISRLLYALVDCLCSIIEQTSLLQVWWYLCVVLCPLASAVAANLRSQER